MEYSPHRLAKYSGMNKDYDFGIKELFVDIKNEKSGKWEIITDEKDIDFSVDSEIEYNINLVEKKMNIESQSIFEKWKINIDTQVEIKPKYGIEEKMDLQIIE